MTPGGGHDLVRPFVMTGGRTRTGVHDVGPETTVCRSAVPLPTDLPREQEAIAYLCAEPIAVAELAVRLRLAVAVVTVVVGDMISVGLIAVHRPDPVEAELSTLTKLIERVRDG